MTFGEVLKNVKELSYSQGLYGRIYRNLATMDVEHKKKFEEECKNWKDIIDMVRAFEC